MGLTLDNLDICFNTAIKENFKYVAVLIEMRGFKEAELIVNKIENAGDKLEYYKKAYSQDLVLKSNDGIKIVGFTYANSLEDIEQQLIK